MAKNSRANNNMGKKKFIAIGLIILIIVAGFFIFNYYRTRLAGQAVLNIQTIYVPNETLKGSLSLSLKEGELIPSNSAVRVSMGGNNYDYQLSSLVSESTTNGKFYAEDRSLSGEGAGYGVQGVKETYPEVSFIMQVNTASDKNKNKETKAETTAGTTSATTTTTETTPKSNSINKNEKEEKPKQTEEKSGNKSGNTPVTGNVVAELSVEIEGKTSKNNPYTHTLADGETVEIISSSQPVSLSVEGNIVSVATDYSEKVQGFGQDYLGDSTAYTLNLDFSSLNLIVQEGEFKVSLVSGNEEIASVLTALNVETPEQNATSTTEEENETENIIANITTNITNVTTNITKNITFAIENLSDYALTDEELFKLKAVTGSSDVKITKSEIANGRLIIRFQIGNYWLEKSYDSAIGNSTLLKDQMELDQAKWVKILARNLLKIPQSPEKKDEFLGNYSLS